MSKPIRMLWLVALSAAIFGGEVAAEPLRVVADFEGASVQVVEVDQAARRIDFAPGGDAERGWPCWWYFRVDGLVPQENITLRLRASTATVARPGAALAKPLSSVWALVDRATYSPDGKTWHRTEKGVRDGDWMTYSIRAEASSVFVAWGPPYTPTSAVDFLRKSATGRSGVEVRELVRSRGDRSVPMLHVAEGDLPTERRSGVWIQARQHAWESGSSWVAHGFIEWLLSDEADAVWLRRHAEIYVVPIMDVDNTATGNGGKDENPQDHNRDWSEKPHWNEVAAAQRIVGRLAAQGRMDLFLDLHNPGPTDPTFFFTLSEELLSSSMLESRDRFIRTACARLATITPQLSINDRPKAAGAAYTAKWREMSANWVALRGNPHTVSLCLETGWNHPGGTVETYRAVGARIAGAASEHLRKRREAKPAESGSK